MKKRMTVGGVLVIVLIAFTLFAFLGMLTNGFQSWDKDTIQDNLSRDLNEENLYKADYLTISDQKDGNGLKIDVNEKTGAIVLNGTTVEAYEDLYIAHFTLDKGTYTLTAFEDASFNGVYLILEISDTSYYFDFTPGNTIEITADNTECSIVLNVAKGVELDDAIILPVIVSGDDAGEFYA